MKRFYKVLGNREYHIGEYSIVPIRHEDRRSIMKWRNEQMYHLRQDQILTELDQDSYFDNVIRLLFDSAVPDQILFSYLENNKCIGYGGLVHINWHDHNAEISFLLDTVLDNTEFEKHWASFISLIREVAFKDIGLHKIFTFAYNIRPNLFGELERFDFVKEAHLAEHKFKEGKGIDVIIHSLINEGTYLRNANIYDKDITFKWATDSIIRKYAFNKEAITVEEHDRWFRKRLESPECYYFILVSDSAVVGSIRFDVDPKTKEKAKLSYLVDSQFHGNGFGLKLIDKGISRLNIRNPGVKHVIGMVHHDNKASNMIFEKLSFLLTESTPVYNTYMKTMSNENIG